MSDVIVITGLAQGMGRETAKRLAARGDSVAGFDVDAQGIDSLRKELAGPAQHLLMPLDITDRPGIVSFRDRVIERFGRIDTVVSNVGIGFFGAFEEVDLNKALRCFEINVIGAAALFQAFLPHLRQQGGGKLIAMSSLVGRIPFPFESIYTGTKFALEGMMKATKMEVKPFGIKVAVIEPAQVSTSFAAKIHWLPAETSPYFGRVRRFIARDNALIKTAPTPAKAAERIVEVIKSKNPAFYNQIDFRSTFFLALNQFLPASVRDRILVNFMDINS
jgi:short-subunit dehydrogenase